MFDAIAMTAQDLLSIPASEPERAFPADKAEAKRIYHGLASRWHPDHTKDDATSAVFQHVQDLYKSAVAKIEAGAWVTPGVFDLTDTDGRRYRIRHQRKHEFELGDLYVAPTVAVFRLDETNKDLFERARKAIGSFRFASSEMEKEFARYLPKVKKSFETASGPVMVIEKTPDLILLKDLLSHLGGRMDPTHVAWILSSLHNIVCYLVHAGISHNAISLDTCFVSPEYHSVALLGGWWYATKVGEKMAGAPARTVTYAPRDLLDSRKGDIRVDLEMIRALGRELLGDVTGARLGTDKSVPKAMADWLRCASGGDAVRDYELWQETLKASFGARRFVRLAVSGSDVYKEM